MKKIIFLAIFIIFLIGFITIISSAVVEKDREKIDKRINEINSSKIKVIISLNHNLKKSSVNSLDISKNNFFDEFEIDKIGHTFSDGSFSVELTKEEINNLENSDLVKKIYYDYPVKAFLQDSVPLINATRTWSLLDSGVINLTGINQTICIIDTGVNYTHSDLGECYGNNNASSSCKVIGGWDFVNNDNDPIDDHGHGTHLAGIAAANNSIRGVAPNAKIIAIKALGNAGLGFSSDVAAGIDWCVGNSSAFNIITISLSLGGLENYTNYCDTSDQTTANSINAAIAKNISVVVATGNNGNYTAIASPACIENATRVSATDKNDVIASFAQRNSLVKLFAPGDSINSTWYGGSCISGFTCRGNYAIASGTSMATPHVAGAIALIRQFLALSGQSKTPKEIEAILNNTGKRITDSSSGFNFSRIDVYSAILSLDNLVPNVSLISPANSQINLTQNQTFSCNATDWQLSNITFYLWNSTSLFYNETKNATGIFNETSFNYTNINHGSYKWNCLAYDLRNNKAFASSNFTLIIGGVFVTLTSPLQSNFTNQNLTDFSCLAQSEQSHSLTNITFYLWNSSALAYNETRNISGTSNQTNFNYTFNYENNYKWNCLSVNNASNTSFGSENYTIVYDVTKPFVNLISPADAVSYTSNSQTIDFVYNVSENFNISSCSLIINNAISLTNNSIYNLSINQSFSQTFSAGSYSWSVNCTDLAGNLNSSETKSFFVSSPAIQQSSSGGGGGGSSSLTNTYTITKEQVSSGYTKELAKNDKINFEFFDEKTEQHTLTINDIGENFVNITIQSEPIKVVLGIGQSVKLNLTSANYYNLYVKLESITNNRAKITIQTINEPIIKNVITTYAVKDMNETNVNDGTKNEGKSNLNLKKIIFIAIVLVVVLIHLIDERFHKDKIKKIGKKIRNRKKG